MAAMRSRKSAFVPRVLVRTAIVGVIPACALGCGSSSAPPTDAGQDAVLLGVAAVAYPAYEAGADSGSDAPFLGVAAVAYPAYEAGAPDGPRDAGPTDMLPDVFRGPMPLAVTAYEVDPPKRG
jgi:hypothetical protein